MERRSQTRSRPFLHLIPFLTAATLGIGLHPGEAWAQQESCSRWSEYVEPRPGYPVLARHRVCTYVDRDERWVNVNLQFRNTAHKGIQFVFEAFHPSQRCPGTYRNEPSPGSYGAKVVTLYRYGEETPPPEELGDYFLTFYGPDLSKWTGRFILCIVDVTEIDEKYLVTMTDGRGTGSDANAAGALASAEADALSRVRQSGLAELLAQQPQIARKLESDLAAVDRAAGTLFDMMDRGAQEDFERQMRDLRDRANDLWNDARDAIETGSAEELERVQQLAEWNARFYGDQAETQERNARDESEQARSARNPPFGSPQELLASQYERMSARSRATAQAYRSVADNARQLATVLASQLRNVRAAEGVPGHAATPATRAAPGTSPAAAPAAPTSIAEYGLRQEAQRDVEDRRGRLYPLHRDRRDEGAGRKARELYSEALDHRKKGELDKAEDKLHKAVARWPAPKLYYELSDVLLERGRTIEALNANLDAYALISSSEFDTDDLILLQFASFWDDTSALSIERGVAVLSMIELFHPGECWHCEKDLGRLRKKLLEQQTADQRARSSHGGVTRRWRFTEVIADEKKRVRGESRGVLGLREHADGTLDGFIEQKSSIESRGKRAEVAGIAGIEQGSRRGNSFTFHTGLCTYRGELASTRTMGGAVECRLSTPDGLLRLNGTFTAEAEGSDPAPVADSATALVANASPSAVTATLLEWRFSKDRPLGESETESCAFGYRAEGLVITTKRHAACLFTGGTHAGDVRIEVTAGVHTTASGLAWALGFGVDPATGAGYRLYVNSNATYALSRIGTAAEGNSTLVGWTRSDALLDGIGVANRAAVELRGREAVVILNGRVVQQVTLPGVAAGSLVLLNNGVDGAPGEAVFGSVRVLRIAGRQ